MSGQSKVLFKVCLDPKLEPTWIGPKLFEWRLITHDQANKLQWKFLDLCKLIKPKDLCQKCDKLSVESVNNGHLCQICIGNNFGQDTVNGTDQEGIHIYSTRREKSYTIRFRTLKLEIIGDPKIIKAFKIVNPDGCIRSHNIIDDIIYWHDLIFWNQKSIANPIKINHPIITKKDEIVCS
uniref:Uncharacterized protein n=1 Tax=Pithovirus LCPAC201 TaxID=2506591 RepID=A0A481Z5Y6_9VIRU|nr:MAG: hypothetical protein LCPAC201_02560 [Pithovirus LCPAC201]